MKLFQLKICENDDLGIDNYLLDGTHRLFFPQTLITQFETYQFAMVYNILDVKLRSITISFL